MLRAMGVRAVHRSAVAIVVIAVVASVPTFVAACGSCMNLRGGLTVVHPKSLGVAVAIRRDLDAGLLKKGAAVPESPSRRHSRELQTGRILAERFFLSDGFELLLIEDGMHYRIQRSVDTRTTKRPPSPPIRWVTGRDVLQSLLANELDLETAVKRGLVVVEKIGERSVPTR